MKAIICAGALLLAVACAPMPTLDELEAEALRSGDWSLVEQREALLAKRKARRPMQCASGQVSYCEKDINRLECQCVSRSAFSGTLASR